MRINYSTIHRNPNVTLYQIIDVDNEYLSICSTRIWRNLQRSRFTKKKFFMEPAVTSLGKLISQHWSVTGQTNITDKSIYFRGFWCEGKGNSIHLSRLKIKYKYSMNIDEWIRTAKSDWWVDGRYNCDHSRLEKPRRLTALKKCGSVRILCGKNERKNRVPMDSINRFLEKNCYTLIWKYALRSNFLGSFLHH